MTPWRIVSGSMAETLLGPHHELDCPDCRFTIRWDVEFSRGDGLVVCPNCGRRTSDREASTRPGDRVLVSPYITRAPRRWEVIAFRNPEGIDEVKRVVGFPGELVSIEDGDVLIDGSVVPKSLSEMRATAILVYDDAHRPNTDKDKTPRIGWSAEPTTAGFNRRRDSRLGSGWVRDGAGWRFGDVMAMDVEWGGLHPPYFALDRFPWDGVSADSTHRRRLSTTANSPTDPSAISGTPNRDVAWIRFHASPPFSPPGLATAPSPVLDTDPYNQSLSRKPLNEVHDLLLVGRFDWRASRPIAQRSPTSIDVHADLVLELRDGVDSFRIAFDRNGDVIRLYRTNVAVNHETPSATASSRNETPLPNESPYEWRLIQRVAGRSLGAQIWWIEASLCDRRVLLSLNGVSLFEHPYEPTLPRTSAASPLGIGVHRSAQIQLRRLQVWRDIHYLHRDGDGRMWRDESPLEDDQYFVLGDNAPASADSRYGVDRRVRHGDILGVVLKMRSPRDAIEN